MLCESNVRSIESLNGSYFCLEYGLNRLCKSYWLSIECLHPDLGRWASKDISALSMDSLYHVSYLLSIDVIELGWYFGLEYGFKKLCESYRLSIKCLHLTKVIEPRMIFWLRVWIQYVMWIIWAINRVFEINHTFASSMDSIIFAFHIDYQFSIQGLSIKFLDQIKVNDPRMIRWPWVWIQNVIWIF